MERMIKAIYWQHYLTKIIVTVTLLVLSLTSFAQQKLRFGVVYFYPPFIFSTNSGYVYGFDIDLANAVCQQLHAECSFTPMSLSDAFASLNQNKVDAVIGAVSITPQREAEYTFSESYLKSAMSFVALNTSQIAAGNLQGKRVGVIKDSTFYTYLIGKYGNSIQLKTYDTNEQLAAALSNKEIDVMLLDTPAANYWVGYSVGLFKTIGQPTYLPSDKGYGIVVKRGNETLIDSLNRALSTIMRNGTLQKIKQTYFSKQLPEQMPRA
jgi:arginine transport system substrate-binding protein